MKVLVRLPDQNLHRSVGTGETARIEDLLYFAYGSNLHLPQLRERARSAVPLGVARLPGYRLAFTRQSTRWEGLAADIVSDSASEVWGAIVSIEQGELHGLDRSEFIGVGYRRIEVEPLPDPGQIPVAAFTYEVIDKKREGKPPSHYLDTMVKGARQMGLPHSWIAYLHSFA